VWEEVKIMNLSKMSLTNLTISALALLAGVAVAQEIPNEGPVPTSALISVISKHDAQLDPTMLKLQVNRHDSPITAVTPLAPKNLQIAILIDDGLRGSFSLQLNELRDFVTELPAGTQTLVGYMQNGTVRTRGFSASPAEVVGDLRIPLSSPSVSASPYFSLSDFVKRWPSNQPGARIVLLITNGVDPYNGRPSVMNQDSPYVQTAQDDAQRAGVAVYSIYYPDAGMRGGSFSGQSYLQQVAEATGGQSFYQGTIPPVSFKPYLEQFRKAIFESYTVSFKASATNEKRDTLTQIKISTSQPGVKIIAPQAVHPGVTQ
jgi:hypothetical protein